MLHAPIPHNDGERLQALRALLILDTPPEERYDRLVQFAATEFDVPISVISLVDQTRQWFKARVGLDVCATDRDVSFCGHALQSDDFVIVEDTLRDARFADNPLVLGDPNIRFYVGAPLRIPSGLILGAFCIIDRVPRSFDRMDLAILGSLRDLAVAEMLAGNRPASSS